MKRNILEVKYDSSTGDHYIELPPELLNQVGWDFGDTIIWKDNEDGSYTLEKKMGDQTSNSSSDEKVDGAATSTIDRVSENDK